MRGFIEEIRKHERDNGGASGCLRKSLESWRRDGLGGHRRQNPIFSGGVLYVFDYKGGEMKEYIDYKPYVLCLNALPETSKMTALNLNLLPMRARIELFMLVSRLIGYWDREDGRYYFKEKPGLNYKNLKRSVGFNPSPVIKNYEARDVDGVTVIPWNSFPDNVYLSTGKIKTSRGVKVKDIIKKTH